MSLDLPYKPKAEERSAERRATVRVLLLDGHPAEAAALRGKLADSRYAENTETERAAEAEVLAQARPEA